MLPLLVEMADVDRQRRPPGRHDTVDDEWKDAVRAALKAQGISRADLARQIGVTPSAITLLLKPGTSQTRLASKIAKVLGMRSTAGKPVAAAVVDDSLERVLRAWRKMDTKARESFAALAETVTSSR